MDWQRMAADFARDHDLLQDPAAHALDLSSEVGEVAKALLEATDYGRRRPCPGPELAVELGDALYALLTLAEVCGVDAGLALRDALAKYERRLAGKGSAGST
ncbi:MAG: MazG-like family protein [Anaerolineae bacterium]